MADISVKEAAEVAKIKPHTLRYYESIGLLKDIQRNAAGQRVYSEADLRWLAFINRLRATGMSIRKMQEYARLRHLGDSTVSERKALLCEHLKEMDDKIAKLLEVREYVVGKIEIYNEMEETLHERGKSLGTGL
ncbi:MerR family transcriptional regulator [Heliobacterium gestii]|uniref:MerR family transcriptional regulator n=1 Tax=Heliomicrobium gestii TaxID=2699 RepID=A0A845LH71_HELGE|nr:MerR family transcriptional regulator [Heliomicrobium gestii]MBM7868122.1 DNA-binding transcriptional MerR regulator [Heliomicrobium gestii]MZP44350.1 MerR family transcriptional regulator [Heliomicrobium gestii]